MNHALYIAQKIFSLWGKYDVVNQNNELVYTVQGQLAFLRRQLIYDRAGREIGSIRQKLSFLLPQFAISEYGKEVGTISGKFSLMKIRLEMQYFGWQVEGDFLGWNYDVFDASGSQIASIRKELWHLSDYFAIHYDNPDNALSLLLLVLAIDCVMDVANS